MAEQEGSEKAGTLRCSQDDECIVHAKWCEVWQAPVLGGCLLGEGVTLGGWAVTTADSQLLVLLSSGSWLVQACHSMYW